VKTIWLRDDCGCEGSLNDDRGSALLLDILVDYEKGPFLLRKLDRLLPLGLDGPDEDDGENEEHAEESTDATAEDERNCAALPLAEVHERLLEADEERSILEAVDALALPKSGAEGVGLCGLEPGLDVDDGDVSDFDAVRLNFVVRMLVVRMRVLMVRMLLVNVGVLVMVRVRVRVMRMMGVVAMDLLDVDRLETHIFPEHVRDVGCLGAHAAAMVRPVRNNHRGEVRDGRHGWDTGVRGSVSKTEVCKFGNLRNLRRWCLSAHSSQREGSDQKAGRNTHDDVCGGFSGD